MMIWANPFPYPIIAGAGGPVVPDDSLVSTCPPPQSGDTKGEECRYSPLWRQKKEWLPWQSNDQERGLKAHRVTGGGHIEEADDNPIVRRKKIKGISSRQWEA